MADRRRSKRDRTSRGGGRATHDEVPDAVVTRAKAAFRQRGGGELAPLVFDSLIDDPTPTAEHRMRFEHPREHVELIVSTDGECTLRGRVEPTPVRVELELEGAGVALIDAATSGDFAFAGVPRGLKRMVLIGPPGSQPVHTDWFRT